MTANAVTLKCTTSGKKPTVGACEHNPRSSRSGSLAEIIPDWPQLKSFDRTKIKKKVFSKLFYLKCTPLNSRGSLKSGINFTIPLYIKQIFKFKSKY